MKEKEVFIRLVMRKNRRGRTSIKVNSQNIDKYVDRYPLDILLHAPKLIDAGILEKRHVEKLMNAYKTWPGYPYTGEIIRSIKELIMRDFFDERLMHKLAKENPFVIVHFLDQFMMKGLLKPTHINHIAIKYPEDVIDKLEALQKAKLISPITVDLLVEKVPTDVLTNIKKFDKELLTDAHMRKLMEKDPDTFAYMAPVLYRNKYIKRGHIDLLISSYPLAVINNIERLHKDNLFNKKSFKKIFDRLVDTHPWVIIRRLKTFEKLGYLKESHLRRLFPRAFQRKVT